MKKWISILAIALLFVTLVPFAASAANGGPGLSVSDITISSDEKTFEVDVQISNNPGINAMTVDVDYGILNGYIQSVDIIDPDPSDSFTYSGNSSGTRVSFEGDVSNLEGTDLFKLKVTLKDDFMWTSSETYTVSVQVRGNAYRIANNRSEVVTWSSTSATASIQVENWPRLSIAQISLLANQKTFDVIVSLMALETVE